MSYFRAVTCLALLFGASACSSNEPVAVEYYQPAYRSSPPAPVYSRVMWSHLPHPIAPKSKDTAPLMLPTVAFELPNSNLGEAIEALAQTMGYRWHYPENVSSRRIRIRMEGNVEEVLAEISRQANVQSQFDHKQRLIIVLEPNMIPKLPGT